MPALPRRKRLMAAALLVRIAAPVVWITAPVVWTTAPVFWTTAPLWAQSPVVRRGGAFLFDLPAGRAEIHWLTPSTFRFQYCLHGVCPARASGGEDIDLEVSETRTELRMLGQYLDVRLNLESAALSVRAARGETLVPGMRFEVPARSGAGPQAGLRVVSSTPAGESFYGLNATAADTLNLRGRAVISSEPLMLSSLGYGLFFPGARDARFDIAPGHSTLWMAEFAAPNFLEMFFYYGPTPKEVFEEHVNVVGPIPMPRLHLLDRLDAARVPSYAKRVEWKAGAGCGDFGGWLRALLHGSLSGSPAPALELDSLPEGEAGAALRALAALFPIITGKADGELPAGRERWKPYLYTYLEEVRDRGLPIIRPMAMQFPSDARISGVDDAFMLGDEVLVAPRCGRGAAGKLALPAGLWTDLATNERHRGGGDIDIPPEAPPLTVLARNGSIVPLLSRERPGLLELHYFPRLGAEFFLSEDRRNDYSQFHAAPALDILRLEIESVERRSYEWVVHQVTPALSIESGGRPWPGVWRYDEQSGNLLIPAEVEAGKPLVLNVRLREPL